MIDAETSHTIKMQETVEITHNTIEIVETIETTLVDLKIEVITIQDQTIGQQIIELQVVDKTTTEVLTLDLTLVKQQDTDKQSSLLYKRELNNSPNL